MLPDSFENFVQFIKNILIPESDYFDIQLIDQHCSELIIVRLLCKIVY